MSAGHIQRRGENSWRLKYDLGRDPISGKRITKYRTVTGGRRAAQQALRSILAALDHGQHADAGKLTTGAWLAQWLEEARHSVAPKTWERYAEIVIKHLTPALGAIPLAKLAAVHIQAYYALALASGRRDGRGGLAAQTVRHFDRVLNVALKRARKLKLIASNPVEDAEAPRVERHDLKILDADETARLLAAASSTRLYVPIFLALASGCRRGEVLGLPWSAVDLPGQSLRVVQSLEQTSTSLRLKPPKTRRSKRTIALSPSVVEVLQAHRVEQLEERLLLGLGGKPELVFTTITGEMINPRNFSKEFARIVKRAGVRTTFHGLRHAHITRLLEAGVHPKIAADRAGHSSVAVTMDTYSHVIEGMQQDAALRIDAGLRSILAR